jgi:4-amino-4-deoxy-L-arabinose transferase-like glycosyltransferase
MTVAILGKSNTTEGKSRDMPKEINFKLWLFSCTLLGLIARILFVTLAKWHQRVWNDGGWYHCVAEFIANGNFFRQPFVLMFNNGSTISCTPFVMPTAAHPPLWPIFLAMGDLFNLNTLGWQLFENIFISTFCVIMVGIIAKKIAGPLAGILAAFIAALYPGMYLATGQLTSETLAAAFTLICIYFAYKLIETPKTRNAIGVGVFGAAAALTRSELFLLAIFVAVGFAFTYKSLKIKERLKLSGISLLAMTLILSPWLIRNLIVFSRPEFISTESGFTMDMANCNTTYYPPPGSSFSLTYPSMEGYWTLACSLPQPSTGDESYDDAYYRNYAIKYIRANFPRYTLIALIRVGRLWQFFDPIGQARLDFESEQWNYPGDLVKIACFYVFIPLILYGISYLRKQKKLVYPLISPPIIATIAVILFTEDPRYRVMSEGGICILTAIGTLALIDKFFHKQLIIFKN